MPNDKFKNYSIDLGKITKEYAREAIDDHAKAKGSDSENFKCGYMMGLHRFVTLMQQQADSFDIKLEDIGLDDIDESEFLKL